MGILFRLLALPVTGPTNGLLSVLRAVRNEADKSLYDPDQLRAELARLQNLVDDGTLDEATYEQMEEALLERLEMAQQRDEEDEE